MTTPAFSRRLLLGSLLAALTGWLGGCQRRTDAPPQPADRSTPPQEERHVHTSTVAPPEKAGVIVTYTYDADGNVIHVQRSDGRPAQRPDRTPQTP
jgi:hypothetical protein